MGDAFGLYLVMSAPVAGYEACAMAAVRCGVRFLQLRMKGAPRDAVLETALRVREITLGSDTLFIVNDENPFLHARTCPGVECAATGLMGRFTRKVVPRLIALSTVMCPPCSWTI